MDLKRQASAPLYEAIEKFRKKRIVPFDVPGHKRGRGNPELVDLLGERCVGIDVNSMKPLDNLCHPVSVIKEAEELTAEAFGAEHAFFMVGGTTQAVQNMVLSVCKAGDEIIVPRNVHKSVINALILCGAIPVYLNTEINAKLGIVLGVTVQQVEKTIQEHPNAVAVLVNNPTYYGICSDIKGICDIASTNNPLSQNLLRQNTRNPFSTNICAIKKLTKPNATTRTSNIGFFTCRCTESKNSAAKTPAK